MAKIVFLPKSGNIVLNEPDGDSFIVYPAINHYETYGPGVYKWFYKDGKDCVIIYVGRSKSDTVLRGISEAFRLTFSTDTQGTYHQKLDTDYVVGSVLKILTLDYGKTCYWKYSDPAPDREHSYLPSLLQTKSGNIDKKWKLYNRKRGYWKHRTANKIQESEDKIKAILDEMLQPTT